MNEILEQEKARRAARIQQLLDPCSDEAQQADALLEHNRQMDSLKTYAMWGGGALALARVVWWMLSD